MRFLILDPDLSAASQLSDWFVANGWPQPGIAGSTHEAEQWMAEKGGCDILVAEAWLQPEDGPAFRSRMLAAYPKMRVVFLSALDVSGLAPRMAGCGFVAKPASGEDVDAAIRALFEQPAPQPAATVAASPRPVAVATPRAVAATPTATPTAVPKPAVAAVAKPAVATPAVATPAAAKPAVAKPAVATPAVAKPAVAAPVAAKPSAAPKVAGAPQAAAPAVRASGGSPKVAVASSAAAVQKAASTSSRIAVRSQAAALQVKETELPPDELVGRVVGQYKIEAKIGEGRMGPIYRANQANMARLVRFYVLDPKLAADAANVERFVANASAKANVNHPSVFAIYEAGESDGIYYYSCEYDPSSSLEQLREAGKLLDETIALQVLKVTSDVLGNFATSGVKHEMITARALLIGHHARPRVANIAAVDPQEPGETATEINRLADILKSCMQPVGQGPQLGVHALLEQILVGEGPASWPALHQSAVALEPKVAPQDAYKLEAQDRAAIRMIEEAKKRQKRNMLISMAVSLCLLATALTVAYFTLFANKGAGKKNFSRMIEIPAGEFTYQDGTKVNLPTFYIDEYEVTIGQYAEFLDFLEKNPGAEAQFAHPKQPKGKSHVPQEWADMKDLNPPMPGYYTRAIKWGKYQGAPLDLNSPVFGLDWFDAYAYAKWKGRRLPTEQEWEKAARGTDGRKYAWGNEEEPKRTNSGRDLDPNPKKGGEIDGWKRWSPVDAVKSDKSPFGVIGMGGNVSEWTATYDTDPQSGGFQIPVIRGGNWRNPDFTVTRRVLLLTDIQSDNALGFRTASDTPPDKK